MTDGLELCLECLHIETSGQFENSGGPKDVTTLWRRSDLGLELIDAHTMVGKHMRDLMNNSRRILSEKTELDPGALVDIVPRCRALRSDVKQPGGLELIEACHQILGRRIGHGGLDHTCELAGEFGHVASDPVTVVRRNHTAQAVDETRFVVAKHGDDDGCHDGTLTREVVSRPVRSGRLISMQRTIVQVMQVRMSDILPGDIVNKNHEDARGWFEVKELSHLHSGDVAVLAHTEKDSINGAPHDIVGVQVAKVVEIPNQVRAA